MKIAEMIEATPDAAALAIRKNIAQVESALSEFDKIEAGLADLRERFPADLVYDLSSVKGRTEAITHRAAWRDPRINVEKFRKVGKAPVLALGKDIDARAAWLTTELLKGEEPIDEQIKAEEARKEAEKQAKILAEFGRVQAIQEALAQIHMDAMGAVGKSSTVIQSTLDEMTALVLDPLVFQEQMAQAQAAKDSAIGKLSQALKAQLFTEAEAEKLAAERAELEQLRKAAAAQKIKDDAAAAEQARAERERIAVEQRAAREGQQKLDAEAEQKRAADDAAAAEVRKQAQAKHEAEMEAQRAAMREAQALADAALAKEQAKQRKMAVADKKMRDAAPIMLKALLSVVGHVSIDLAGTVNDAIAAAT